jgi:tetratricopeptide (TPR) repeat protein
LNIKPEIEMKKVVLILLLVPALVFAQKPIKPNLNKALNAWKAGKLQEAKEMIDVCVTDPKLSLNGDTYYYKGLIYASLDTTSNEAFKSLATEPLTTAIEALAKAEQMAGKKEYFVTDGMGLPVLRTQQIAFLNGHYLNQGVKFYQEDDHENAMKYFEKSEQLVPGDTTSYFFASVVAQNLEDYDKAITNINTYLKNGGTSSDAYSWLINIYSTHKEDKNKALEVAREAKNKFPAKTDFARTEIGLLIDLDKIDEAKAGLEKAVKEEPGNKILHFFLGYTHLKQENVVEARKCFEESVKIDPTYFDAQLYLSKVVSEDAKKIKRQMNALGISAADKKKKFELDAVYTTKLREALPYWEKCEKLNPSDQEVLDELYSIYSDLDMQPQVKRIEKRFKELGIE